MDTNDACPKCGAPVVYVEMENDAGHTIRVPVGKFSIEERIVIPETGKAFRSKCGVSHYKTCQQTKRWRMR